MIWSQQVFITAFGASLIHSLWQGAALGGVGMALHGRLKRVPANVRHDVYGLLLLTLFVVWLGSLCCLYQAGVRDDAVSSPVRWPAAAGAPVDPSPASTVES